MALVGVTDEIRISEWALVFVKRVLILRTTRSARVDLPEAGRPAMAMSNRAVWGILAKG